jgi:hypothetical protein
VVPLRRRIDGDNQSPTSRQYFDDITDVVGDRLFVDRNYGNVKTLRNGPLPQCLLIGRLVSNAWHLILRNFGAGKTQ